MRKVVYVAMAVVGVIVILWLVGSYCIDVSPEEQAQRDLEEERKDAEKAFDEERKSVDDLPDCDDAREVLYVVEWKLNKDYNKSYISKIENYYMLDIEITDTAATIRCKGEAWKKDGRRFGNIEYWVRKNKGDKDGTHYAGWD